MNIKIKKINCKCKKRAAKRLKITITDEKGKRFSLPGIPFWFLIKSTSLVLFIVRLSMRNKKNKIQITQKEIYEIINCLRQEPPFTFIEVADKKGNLVEIKTI